MPVRWRYIGECARGLSPERDDSGTRVGETFVRALCTARDFWRVGACAPRQGPGGIWLATVNVTCGTNASGDGS